MLKLILIILLSISSLYAEGLDYSANIGTRSLPFGGAAIGDIGFSKLFWDKTDQSFYKFGYLRPAFKFKTSAVVNRPEVYLDIFPISIFGFTVGHQQTFRSIDLNGFDCVKVQCKGRISSTYARAQIFAGGSNWFATVMSNISFQYSDNKSKPFADETATLIGNGRIEKLWSSDFVLGTKTSKSTSTGYFGSTDRMLVSKQANNLHSIFFKKNFENWNWMVGVGFYQSTLHTRDVTAYLAFKWIGKQSIGFK